jgi:hypothetical protein
MKKPCLLFFLLVSFASFGQKTPSKFGNIPMEDMTMKVYPQDSSASAVVLFDYGLAYVTSNVYMGSTYHSNRIVFSKVFERQVRIKILNKEGLNQADIAIPLNIFGDEKMVSFKAVTYNLDGGQIKESAIGKENTFKEKFNRVFDVLKFSLPNVKEGAIIEYSYKTESAFAFSFNWQFQRSIPVRHSEYWAMIPSEFIFQKYMQGYLPVTNYTTEKTTYYSHPVEAHHYVMKNAPAFKREPFMTSEEDYVSRINFALSHVEFTGQPVYEVMGSWGKLAENLRSNDRFSKAVKGSGFLKDDVAQIVKDITDPMLKIEAISNHVRKNFEWDGYSDYTCESLRKILEKKKGSSGDLNILLASMLDKAGFDVDLVLLSTRDHGFIRTLYPMERQFNYVVASVAVGDKTLLLDATEKQLPFDVLPSRCLNSQGLKILHLPEWSVEQSTDSKPIFEWIDIIPKAKDKTFVSANFSMDGNGEMKGKIDYSADGYDAFKMRDEYFEKGEDKYKKDYLSDKQWTVEKAEFKDMADLRKSAKVTYDVSLGEHTVSGGEVIYLNPYVELDLKENPFKSAKREFPIDFGSRIEKIYSCKISIPEGYSVDEIPKSVALALPENAGRFMYNATQMGNTINITSNFQINRNLFGQDEYLHLKEFYNQVVAKQAEQIVLKKK